MGGGVWLTCSEWIIGIEERLYLYRSLIGAK
jgi:hypothetical protein